MSTQTISYSKCASNFQFPKKNQAIIFDTLENVKIDEYLQAIKKRTDPSNIIAASKITQNRFCFYLKSAALVEDLTEEGKNILLVGGIEVAMRPYVAKLKRVIFSNVHPCVPHDVITDKLKELGVQPKSNLTFLRVGVDSPEFAHIVCFRRQLFVHPDDVAKIPTDFQINFDETQYHIYATFDKMICFLCKKEGHTSKYCPVNKEKSGKQSLEFSQTQQFSQKELTQDDLAGRTSDVAPASVLVNTLEDTNTDTDAASKSTFRDQLITQTAGASDRVKEQPVFNGQQLFRQPNFTSFNNNNKRTHSIVSNSTDNSVNQKITSNEQDNKKKKKKTKVMTPEIIKEQLNTAFESILEVDKSKFPITLDNFSELVISTCDSKYAEVPQVVSNYTENYSDLTVMIKAVHKVVSERTLKTRLTKISNAIDSALKGLAVSIPPSEGETGDSEAEL